MQTPVFIAARMTIPVPDRYSVVAQSIPVVSFGNPLTAEIATVGINPSRKEFLNPSGELLVHPFNRFENLSTLGISTLSGESPDLIDRAYDSCCNYFKKNPYSRWFDQLNPILGAIRGSYYDQTACHLDLVQWATNPTWKDLSPLVKKQLLANDVPFLKQLITNGSFRLLLLNGRSVIKQFSLSFEIPMTRYDTVYSGKMSCQIVSSQFPGGPGVIGWSQNIQSSRGMSTEIRGLIANRVSSLARLKGWA